MLAAGQNVSRQQQSSYTPNSPAARRNWRRRSRSPCRPDCHVSLAAIGKKKINSNGEAERYRERLADRTALERERWKRVGGGWGVEAGWGGG